MKNWCVFSFGKCILLHVPYLLHAHSSSTLPSLFLSFAHLCITSFSLSQPAFFLLLFFFFRSLVKLQGCLCVVHVVAKEERTDNSLHMQPSWPYCYINLYMLRIICVCSYTSYPEGLSNPVLLSLYVEGGLETEWLWILHRCRDWEKCY